MHSYLRFFLCRGISGEMIWGAISDAPPVSRRPVYRLPARPDQVSVTESGVTFLSELGLEILEAGLSTSHPFWCSTCLWTPPFVQHRRYKISPRESCWRPWGNIRAGPETRLRPESFLLFVPPSQIWQRFPELPTINAMRSFCCCSRRQSQLHAWDADVHEDRLLFTF